MSQLFGSLLVLVGLSWGGVGVYAAQNMNAAGLSQAADGYGILLVMGICVLPGLVVAGLGAILLEVSMIRSSGIKKPGTRE